MKHTLQITLCVITLAFASLFPSVVRAAYQSEMIDVSNATSKDFVIGPGKKEVTLKPGERAVVPVQVTNRMGENRTFKIEIEDFTGSVDPQQTVVLLGDDRGPYSLKDYISVPEMVFDLKNGERATIPVTIMLPTDAQPGGLYGSVLVSTVSRAADSATNSGSAVVSRIGTLFFINVPGEVKRDGRLTVFDTVSGARFFGSGPIDFRLLYSNDGSVNVNPYGEIRIKNMIGEEVGLVEVEPWFAMPSSLRLREVSWNREFLFGRYTATAEINRGYDNIIDTLSFSFWVIPSKILAGLVVGCFVLVFAIRFIVTRFEFKRKAPTISE